jgi:hypothetical protein
MKRKQDGLVPSEISILGVAMDLNRHGTDEFYGFQIAQTIEERGEKRYLTGYGTLYRALERLEKQGFLTSWWEDPDVAVKQKRPRRRLYKLTSKAAPAFFKSISDGVPVN